jgi:hypothetical protein
MGTLAPLTLKVFLRTVRDTFMSYGSQFYTKKIAFKHWAAYVSNLSLRLKSCRSSKVSLLACKTLWWNEQSGACLRLTAANC